MAGCFGSHPYDRYLEGQLNAHLKSLEDNEFHVTGTITYRDGYGGLEVAQIDEMFETRFEDDGEVREAFVEQFCKDNWICAALIEDYDLSCYGGDDDDDR